MEPKETKVDYAPGEPVLGGKNRAWRGKGPGTIEIQLTQGQITIIDAQDWDLVKNYRWCLSSKRHLKYAITPQNIKMHRLILTVPMGKFVDHIDHNPLNNRRNNLRECTNAENNRNSRIRNDNTSGFKGVYYDKTKQRFRAIIKINDKQIHVGYFRTPEEASKSYKQAAIKYHGEFASF